MKRRHTDTLPVDGRTAAVKRMLTIAELIRRNGTPDEAAEALDWEQKLSKRLSEVEQQAVAKAA